MQAGGGSCARFEGRSVLGCTAALPSGCASWVRSTNASYWVREIAHNLGLQSGNVPNHATFFDCRLL